ncbi:MAG: adenylate/guanylate cyclase domain-containing protein [Thermoleophilia bacterium]
MDEQRVVTIMHVDVEGSTSLTTREGDELARRVLAHTKRLVRERVEAAGGKEIDAVGDAMMLTFVSTRRAIAGAIDVQRTLVERERAEPGSTLPVRIGLNVGEVLELEGTPFGATVNAGARVVAKAAGGQILVSEMVRQLAGTVPGVSYRDRGRHDFKGFDQKWRLYEVVFDRPPSPARPAPPQRRRRAPWVAAAVAATVLAAAAGAFVATRGGGGDGLRSLHRNTVGLLDPQTGHILKEVHVGSGPRAVAAAAGFVWVANYDDETVTLIVERSGRTATIPVGGHPIAIAADREGAWVLELERRLVYVDRRFARITIRAPAQADRIAIGAGSLWTASHRTTVRRLNRGGRPVGDPIVPDLGTNDLAVSRGTLWACGEGLTPIDVRTGLPGQAVTFAGSCTAVAAAGDAVWCLLGGGGLGTTTRVVKFNAEEGSLVGRIDVEGNPSALAAVADAAWLANPPQGTVTRVSADVREAQTIHVGATPTAVAVGRRGVWVAVS